MKILIFGNSHVAAFKTCVEKLKDDVFKDIYFRFAHGHGSLINSFYYINGKIEYDNNNEKVIKCLKKSWINTEESIRLESFDAILLAGAGIPNYFNYRNLYNFDDDINCSVPLLSSSIIQSSIPMQIQAKSPKIVKTILAEASNHNVFVSPPPVPGIQLEKPPWIRNKGARMRHHKNLDNIRKIVDTFNTRDRLFKYFIPSKSFFDKTETNTVESLMRDSVTMSGNIQKSDFVHANWSYAHKVIEWITQSTKF